MPCFMGPGRCIATHPGNMYTEPWVGVKVKVGDETDKYPFWTRTATLPSGEFEKCTAPPTASSDSSVSTAVSVGLPRVPSKASACHSQRSTSPPAENLLTCSTHGLVYIVSPVFCAYCAAAASKIDRSCEEKRSGFVEPSPTASLALLSIVSLLFCPRTDLEQLFRRRTKDLGCHGKDGAPYGLQTACT